MAVRVPTYDVNTGIGKVDSLAFNENMLMASTSDLEGSNWEGNMMIINALTGETLCNLRTGAGHGDSAWCGRARDALDCVALAGDGGGVQVVRVVEIEGSYTLKPVDSLEEHDDVVSSVSVNVDETDILASASWDRSVKLWNMVASTSTATLIGHTGRVFCVDWSPTSSNLLVSSAEDRRIKIWDRRECGVSAGRCTQSVRLATPVPSVAWNRVSEYSLAAGCVDGSVFSFDTRRFTEPIGVFSGHTAGVYRLAFSPCNNWLASASDDTTVLMHDPSAVLRSQEEPAPPAPISAAGESSTASVSSAIIDPLSQLTDHTDYVRGLAWDSTRPGVLATGAWDHSVKVYEMANSTASDAVATA